MMVLPCTGQPIPNMPNFCQHPPFFSKMRTFYKNRLAWLHFYRRQFLLQPREPIFELHL
jgi:hypothetical protein